MNCICYAYMYGSFVFRIVQLNLVQGHPILRFLPYVLLSSNDVFLLTPLLIQYVQLHGRRDIYIYRIYIGY